MSANPPSTALAMMADEDLLSRVDAGDPGAFEVIYERHSRVAFSLAYRLLGDRHAAEDLVQDAFLSAWRNAKAYAPTRGSVRTWLLSILHNRGIDRLRTTSAMTRRQEALEQMELQRPPAPDAAAEGVERVLADTVRKELGTLPQEQVEVLTLAYYGGFTHQEISEMLQVPLGTVKSRMRLGLDRLRRGVGFREAVQ